VPREGREWLSITLLGLFAVVLLGAIIYLFTGDHTGQSQTSNESSSLDSDSNISAEGLRYSSPEETARWQSALDADTAYGYQLFMEDYPDSIHQDQAIIHLQRLDHQAWGYAQEQDTKEAVENYIQAFPGGLHEADAKIQSHEFAQAEAAAQREQNEQELRDEQAWENARTVRSIAVLDQYLSEWPGGLHADEARNLRRQLESELNESRAFAAAAKLDTIEAYQSYVDAFPQGRNLARALEAIDNRTLRPGKTFTDCDGCPTMVVVPAGSYWQGSEENAPLALKMEMPRHLVAIAEPFAVGVFEVTMAQWDQCVADGGCKTRPPDNGWGRDSRPVIMVSWNDAQEYTSWLSGKTGQSYGLPSESQWEYIARAGEESDWIGGGPAKICEYGNVAGEESGFRWQHPDCADQAAIETLPAGSFEPNAFGIYDVVGNVAEWTLDCMNLSYLDAPADGSSWGRGICSSRMTRGGSWFTGSREVRLPARFNLKNGDRNDFTGFRVVRKVEPL
jgi:formylglycine-generating enzyme required for sulfatase activity